MSDKLTKEQIENWLIEIDSYGQGDGQWIPQKEFFELLCKRALSSPDAERLEEIISAIDRGLGDTDITHLESDEDIKQQAPIQWACTQLSLLTRALSPGQAAGAGEDEQRRRYAEGYQPEVDRMRAKGTYRDTVAAPSSSREADRGDMVPAHWRERAENVIALSSNKNTEYEAGRQAVMLLAMLICTPAETTEYVRVHRSQLERWQLLFTTGAEFGITSHYPNGDPTPNGKQQERAMKEIHTLLAAPSTKEENR